MARVVAVVGAQWGDEGKGKWCDMLSKNAHFIARFQGGNNAGHTIYVDGQKLVLHHIPSGFSHHNQTLILTSGMVINPVELHEEVDLLKEKVPGFSDQNIWISEQSHIITPWHIYQDKEFESLDFPIGTTKKGIGPTYADRIGRKGLMMSSFIDKKKRDKWLKQMCTENSEFSDFFSSNQKLWEDFFISAEELEKYVVPAEQRIRALLKTDKTLFLEGAQGALLDIYHGTYPFVTSSFTTVGGAVASIGFDPRKINTVYGIAKAYVTRVGTGPLPTEVADDYGRWMFEKGGEYGATTGRPRRCGWFDAVSMRHSTAINGYDALFLNKIDVLTGLDEIKIATAYHHPKLGRITEYPADADILYECTPEYITFSGWQVDIPKSGTFKDLPKEAQSYITAIEEHCEVPIYYIGTGPFRDHYLTKL